MPQLTSLPDELLFAIFSHCFRTVSSEASPVHPPSNPLSNYILTPRPYALAHEAFFATYIPVVHITPTSFEWDEGTLLHDLYSPVFSPRGSHRSALAVVAEVRKLRVVVRVEDERQVGTAIYETLREVRRYPKLRVVELVGEGHAVAAGEMLCAVEEGLLRSEHVVRVVDTGFV